MLSRRAFVKRMSLAAVAAAAVPFFLRRLRGVSVVMLKPRPGTKYAKADFNHLTHKIYPTKHAAFERLPHYGLRFRTVKGRLATPEGVTAEALFGGRKDLDVRVASDRRHLTRLGITPEDFKTFLNS